MRQQIAPHVRSIRAHMAAIWRIVANAEPAIFTPEGRLRPEPAVFLGFLCFVVCMMLLVRVHHAL